MQGKSRAARRRPGACRAGHRRTATRSPCSPDAAGQSYRITVNSFLADGGDGFGILPSGTNRVGGAVDLDAVVDYLEPTLTGAPIAPPALDRITLAD